MELDEATQKVVFLYRVVLKRDPDPGGLKTYAEKLRKGELDEYQLAYILYTSEENTNKVKLLSDANKLALADFLNLVRENAPIIYKQIKEAVNDKLYQNDFYSFDVVTLDCEPNSLVVTNHPISSTSCVIYTTRNELKTFLSSLNVKTIDILDDSMHFNSCYFVNSEEFDMPGIIIRQLDKICDKIYLVGDSLAEYLQKRSSKIVINGKKNTSPRRRGRG